MAFDWSFICRRRKEAKGYVRFAVIDHGGSDRHPDRLIGSGTFEDVGTAKDAADRMAERLVTACRHRT
jgi:hypothetical protein